MRAVLSKAYLEGVNDVRRLGERVGEVVKGRLSPLRFLETMHKHVVVLGMDGGVDVGVHGVDGEERR